MSIVAQKKTHNGLSGKYTGIFSNFHSLKKNVPAFIREGGKLPNVGGNNHYLVYHEASKSWYIQPDLHFLIGHGGGFFRIQTSGKHNACNMQHVPT